jgi:superfamily II DNA or RNA helicase
MSVPPALEARLADPGVLTALVDSLSAFPAEIRRRGRLYAEQGRVGAISLEGPRVVAEVQGTRRYQVIWELAGRGWNPGCSCPVGPICKHTYAVACRVLHAARGEGRLDDVRLPRLIPDYVPAPDSEDSDDEEHLDAEPASETDSLREDRGARTRKRELADELARSQSAWERTEILNQMLADWRGERLDLLSRPIQVLLWEHDAELLCWRLAVEWARRVGEPLPPALEPYRHRPDLARRHAHRSLPEVERELVQWAERRRGAPSRLLRVELWVAQSTPQETALGYDVLLTTPRLIDKPRSAHQLRQLHNELARQPTLMSDEHAALLGVLLRAQEFSDYEETASGGLSHLLEHAAGSPLVRWAKDLDPALARRYGVEPGGAVKLGSERVRVLPVCDLSGGEPGIVLRVTWPDGRARSLDQVCYRRPTGGARPEPGVVLADGVFHGALEEPPAGLLEHVGVHGKLPIPTRGRASFIASLAAAFPGLRASLGPHARRHAVAPAVALTLDEDDWLQIRLFAHTAGDEWKPGVPVESPQVLFEYVPAERWERVHAGGRSPEELVAMEVDPDPGVSTSHDDAPTAAAAHSPAAPGSVAPDAPVGDAPAAPPADIWLEEPEPERTASLTSWLALTGARPGDRIGPGAREPRSPERRIGWWVRLGPRGIARIADAWDRRPPGVRWFGNLAVASLLGRARHVTPRLRVRASGVDWLEVAAEWESEALALSDADLERLRAAGPRWVKLGSGWARRDAVEVLDQAAAVLADLGLEPGAGDQRLTVWQLAHATPESLAELERLGADPEALAALRRLRERVREFTGLARVPLPAAFQGELRPYQQEGLDFLAHTGALGLGAILADDMGLGKTVQALAWLAHLRETAKQAGPALVVCPTSVMGNWEREAARFVPGLRVLVLGRGAERHALRQELDRHDLIVTNYALLRRDLESWRETRLFAVVLDEAQNIKNPDAAVTDAARALQTRHRLALTGTPLENRALDLWSIMSVVNPGYLGDRRRFEERFDRPDAPPHARALLAAKLRPVLVRRLKREVASDLPERIEERRDAELTRDQLQLYLSELESARRTIMALAADPAMLKRNRLSVLAHLTKLRQICCHPMLGGGTRAAGSGKFEALFELLEPLLAEGHKVLVFSQFVRCLELLEAEMSERKIAYHLLTGATVKRDRVVEAFQADERPCVFLISLRAGGTGLNLTAASYVVLFDPWWNPAVEAQAIDRTHRIGQDRTVIAYRLVARGTIEEKIWDLQQRKAALVRDVLGEEGFARGLDQEALGYLLADVEG